MKEEGREVEVVAWALARYAKAEPRDVGPVRSRGFRAEDKTQAVLRSLKGEDMELLFRE
jgi:hypothetical protein